jgi:tRNA-Thr(GGU) m(6)t(6)A37 methyltransferase TsaA
MCKLGSASLRVSEAAMTSHELQPIGIVRSSRNVVEDDDWDRIASHIELDPTQFDAEAMAGLETFSHVEVLFLMDRVPIDKIETGARHPRNNPAWPKVGIFAQRGKNRPNRIGATICKIQKVEGTKLYVVGLDAVDGTPLLDLKPWVREFGPRGEVHQPDWISELMLGYFRRK